MARTVVLDGGAVLPVGDWRFTATAADEIADPSLLGEVRDWLPAPVPGTVAGALRDAGRWGAEAPTPLHDRDFWYATRLHGQGPACLRLQGLATLAEVWLDRRLLLSSSSMFLAHEVPVNLAGEHDLVICFRALGPVLRQKKGRARWRPRLVADQGLRHVRTTLLGHMPGWCPPVHAVGPWRPVELVVGPVLAVELRPGLVGDDGVLEVRLTGPATEPARVEVAGVAAALCRDGPDALAATVRLPGVAPWWPHTHGSPTLHEVTATLDGRRYALGRVGFRRIEVDRGADGNGFALRLNGVEVFCRGACWSTADLVALPGGRAAYAPWLSLARDAGMNMIRVGGTMLYESNEFFSLCDETGIMVWQDMMLANFDYPPADAALVERVTREVDQLLARTRGSPSLTVLCGGSEMAQQAAMTGLPPRHWGGRLVDEILPGRVAALRPDLVYLPNTPSGGPLPFAVDHGVSHYYGVGAYLRPPDDARRAGVRFAAECLGFANVPDAQGVRDLGVPVSHHPRWKEGVPRDAGAAWDFEDVRDHYLRLLYAADPLQLRYSDPDRYLELSRWVTAELMETVIGDWRRSGSSCAGALVWMLQDVRPGAGWGVIDARGRPKAAWHALRRAFRPVQVVLTDEGVNGLAVHLINENARPLAARLTLTALRDAATPVIRAEHGVTLAPRSTQRLDAATLAGAFFDFTYAYRFGPPEHDVSVASLAAEDGTLLAEAFHFPRGPAGCAEDPGLAAHLTQDDGGWRMVLRCDRLARAVHLDDARFRAEEDWFHLPPGVERSVRLLPYDDGHGQPDGSVAALNGRSAIRLEPRS